MSIPLRRIGFRGMILLGALALAGCTQADLPAQTLSTTCQSGYLCNAIGIANVCHQRTPPCLPGFQLMCDGGGCGDISCSGQCCRCVSSVTAASSSSQAVALASSISSQSSLAVQNTSSIASAPSNAWMGLELTITPDSPSVLAGGLVSYTLAVRNTNVYAVPNVGVLHLLNDGTGLNPSPLVFEIPAQSACTRLDDSTARCIFGNLQPGQTISTRVAARLAAAPPCRSSLSLKGWAYTGTYDAAVSRFASASVNLPACQSSSVAYKADMQATITAPATVKPGDSVQYAVTYRNNGPHRIMFAHADLSIPLTQTSSNTTVCTKRSDTNYDCNMGTLESGQSVTVIISGVVAANHPCGANAPLVASTQVGAANVPDENQGNNYAGLQTPVICNTSAAAVPFPMAAMTFDITAAPSTSHPGTQHVYTMRVSNGSQEQLQNVVLYSLNFHDQVITSLDSRCIKNGDISATCTIGTMNPGQAATLTLTTSLKSDTPCPGKTEIEAWVYRSDDPQRLTRKLWKRAVVTIYCIDPSLTQCPAFPQVQQKVAAHGERSDFMSTTDNRYYVYTDVVGGRSQYLKGFDAETCAEQTFIAPANLASTTSVWTPSISDNGKILALELPWTTSNEGKISIIDRVTGQKNIILSGISGENGLNDATISRSGRKVVFTARGMTTLDNDPATDYANADGSAELYLWDGGTFTQLTNYVSNGLYADGFIAGPRFETPDRFITIDLGYDPATGQDFSPSPPQYVLFLFDTQTKLYHRIAEAFNASPPRRSYREQIDAKIEQILAGNGATGITGAAGAPGTTGGTGTTGGEGQCIEGEACGDLACGDCAVVNGSCRRLCVQPTCTGGACTQVYTWSDCDALACTFGQENGGIPFASVAAEAFRNLGRDIARSLTGLASLLNPFDR